jgi:hypothetical protein
MHFAKGYNPREKITGWARTCSVAQGKREKVWVQSPTGLETAQWKGLTLPDSYYVYSKAAVY